MSMLLTGAGGSARDQFSFVSTGTSYVGRTVEANSGYTAAWTIEGIVYSGLDPGTVALSGNKTVKFNIEPPSKLTTFACDSNQLTGSIPSLTANTALVTFACYGNQLTGSIPSLTANTALVYFACSSNQLTGSIPSLASNTALVYFDCSSNQLTGSIPSLASNAALVYFYCYGNQLTGSIPSLTSNTALVTFVCSSNQLTGSIPSLASNTALVTFACNGNQFTGSIPSLTSNTALVYFYCYGNQLTDVDSGFAVRPATLTVRFEDNLLTEAAVNSILAAFVAAGGIGGYLNIDGTGNAAPSGQGLTDKSTLQGLGWNVITN
jgi:hypothetical protein